MSIYDHMVERFHSKLEQPDAARASVETRG